MQKLPDGSGFFVAEIGDVPNPWRVRFRLNYHDVRRLCPGMTMWQALRYAWMVS